MEKLWSWHFPTISLDWRMRSVSREGCLGHHSFNKHLFSTSHMPGPRSPVVNRSICGPFPQRAYSLVWKPMIMEESHSYKVRL